MEYKNQECPVFGAICKDILKEYGACEQMDENGECKVFKEIGNLLKQSNTDTARKGHIV